MPLKAVFGRFIVPKGGKIDVPLTGEGVIDELKELKGNEIDD
jgi:hypothetical protein